MGMFAFIKDAGRKVGLFGGREAAEADAAKKAAAEAAAKAEAAMDQQVKDYAVAADIRAAILSYVDIRGLAVEFTGETATVAGTAHSQADAERAVLIAGNTAGVGQVHDELAIEAPAPPSVHHTVVAGDTLSELAEHYYGVLRLFDAIFDANRPMLADPDEIYPGQVLRIPPVAPPTHVVERGETLGTIADHWYGAASKYTVVFEANRQALPDANTVEVGQTLVIPLVDPKVPPLA